MLGEVKALHITFYSVAIAPILCIMDISIGIDMVSLIHDMEGFQVGIRHMTLHLCINVATHNICRSQHIACHKHAATFLTFLNEFETT